MIEVRLQTVKTRESLTEVWCTSFGYVDHKEYRLYNSVASHVKYEQT